MTWVDLVVLAVIAISALLAFMRGLVREVLGIAAWAGAIFAGVWALPRVRPRFEEWMGHSPWVDPVGFAVVFVLSLIVLMLLSRWVWYSAWAGVWRWPSLPISVQGWWFRWCAGPNRSSSPNRYGQSILVPSGW